MRLEWPSWHLCRWTQAQFARASGCFDRLLGIAGRVGGLRRRLPTARRATRRKVDMSSRPAQSPLYIRMHEPTTSRSSPTTAACRPGTVLRLAAWRCASACRRATRWRWSTSPRARRCVRYGVVIGHALQRHRRRQLGARAAAADAGGALALDGLPIATVKRAAAAAARRLHASRATAMPTARSARATSWPSPPPCSAWPASSTSRCSASRTSCCRASRTSTTWSAWSTPTAAASPSTRPTRSCRSARCATSACNPNFGGEVMVVSLGCEKLQPERLLPPGSFAIVDERSADVGDEASSTWSACRTTRTSASCR